MLLTSMLKWQYITLALFVAGMLCLTSPGWAGLIASQTGSPPATPMSRHDLEKEIVAASLEKLGWSRDEAETRIAHLTGDEIHRLSVALDNVMAGGEEEEENSNAIGVGLVIVLILAGITGLYLFSQSNK